MLNHQTDRKNTSVNPLIRVILPTYNRRFVIGEAVQSVLDQTYTNWELHIIDDGSTDETPSILTCLVNTDPRIHVLRCDNGGAAAARNLGISLPGTFDLIAFIDSDDLWDAWHLSEAVAVLRRHPKIGCVFARTESLDLVGKLSESAKRLQMRRMDAPRQIATATGTPSTTDEFLLDGSRLLCALLKEEMCPQMSTVVLRRDAIGAHRFPADLVVLEDLQLWAELASSGIQFAYINRRHASIRYFGDNLTMEKPLEDASTLLKQACVYRFTIDKLRLCRSRDQKHAVKQLIASRSYLLGQCYLANNKRIRAARIYLHGFCLSRCFLNIRGLLGLTMPELVKLKFKSVMGMV